MYRDYFVFFISSASEGTLPHRPTITLTTDFGINDHFVGAMKGVILDIVPEAQIVDICHAVQAFDVFSLVYAREERIHVRHSTSEHYFRQPVSNTFHARDIFAPVAAYLAKLVDTVKFGDEIEDFVRFSAPKPKPVDENRMRGVVLKVDRFGNLITNVTLQDAPMIFEAEPAAIKIIVGNREITDIRKAYAQRPPRPLFGILRTIGSLSISANP